jgi:FtsH-binding integral membrane protein
MKRIIILSSIVLLVANLLFGLILSFYGACNVAMGSFVIASTGLLLYLIHSIKLKDGYKVSLTILFVVAGCLEFILSLIAPNRFMDNWWLIIVIVLIALEAVMLIVTNTISDRIE